MYILYVICLCFPMWVLRTLLTYLAWHSSLPTIGTCEIRKCDSGTCAKRNWDNGTCAVRKCDNCTCAIRMLTVALANKTCINWDNSTCTMWHLRNKKIQTVTPAQKEIQTVALVRWQWYQYNKKIRHFPLCKKKLRRWHLLKEDWWQCHFRTCINWDSGTCAIRNWNSGTCAIRN